MISETTSQKAMEAAELGFIPGMKIPDVPYPGGVFSDDLSRAATNSAVHAVLARK